MPLNEATVLRLYGEQPLPEATYQRIQEVLEPYRKNLIVLKDEGKTTPYFSVSATQYNTFNSCFSLLVNLYYDKTEDVKRVSKELLREFRANRQSEYFTKLQDAYPFHCRRLESIARDLTDAMEFARANKLFDDGSAKKIEELEAKRKQCADDLSSARLRIAQLETFMRIHGLNPEDANDTIPSDVGEGGDNHQYD